jgi:hypothetical protein
MAALRPASRATSRRLATALLWVALLGGVFAMHGLGTHGVMGTADAMAAMDHGGGASHASAGDHGDDGAMPTGHPSPDGGHAGMVMMCLAILVATIVVAWMFGFLRRRPSFTVRRLKRRFLPRPGTTHPPPLARLSVMRC